VERVLLGFSFPLSLSRVPADPFFVAEEQKAKLKKWHVPQVGKTEKNFLDRSVDKQIRFFHFS